jgi:hypothetical protein
MHEHAHQALDPSPAPQPAANSPLRLSPMRRVATIALFGGLIALYLAGAALLGTQSPCGNDLGGVFLPSARFVVAGDPLDMYKVRVYSYPNANGPLGELAIGGALALGRDLNLQNVGKPCPVQSGDHYPLPQDSIGLRVWLTIVFALVPLGIAYEIARVADRWRAEPLTGWKRWLVRGVVLLSPPLWDSLIFYGHIEQILEIWLALMAVRFFSDRRMVLSGALLGLGLLNRTAGIFIVIPLVVVLLYEWRWRDLVLWGASLGAVVLAGLAPFLVHDRVDLLYSLNGFRASTPILDGSFWTLVRGTPLAGSLQPLDSSVALTLALLISAGMIVTARIRSDDPRLYAVICASVICFSLAIKAIWGYYFTEPLMWGIAWVATSRDPRQPWWHHLIMPLFFSAVMLLTEVRISYTPNFFAETGGVRTMVVLTSLGECFALCGMLLGLGIAVQPRGKMAQTLGPESRVEEAHMVY